MIEEKICLACGKQAERESVALCGKILTFKEIYCLDCLAKELKVSRECVDEMIRGYRERGCPAFT